VAVIVKVGPVAQTSDEDRCFRAFGRGHREVVEGRAFKFAAAALGERIKYLADHGKPFFDRKQGCFAGMDANGDDQTVAQSDGLADHVHMAVGDGIKGAGIKRDTGHRFVLPRPDRGRKPISLVPPVALSRRERDQPLCFVPMRA
jgi:hypothetical protein